VSTGSRSIEVEGDHARLDGRLARAEPGPCRVSCYWEHPSGDQYPVRCILPCSLRCASGMRRPGIRGVVVVFLGTHVPGFEGGHGHWAVSDARPPRRAVLASHGALEKDGGFVFSGTQAGGWATCGGAILILASDSKASSGADWNAARALTEHVRGHVGGWTAPR
jgi:hypothetical protein